ncbi:MAG: hypothetical protein QME66_01105 [Candidatus Eisenbacteria bacterium]|nr:hypothetical protein [Candidatus Eisenbacteria bacterium]
MKKLMGWKRAFSCAHMVLTSPSFGQAVMRNAVVLLPVWLLIMICPLAVEGATKAEGYYELNLDVRKQDRSFRWDFDSNHWDTQSNFELRFLSTPRPNTEAFIKTHAEWDPGNNSDPRPGFQFTEGHAKYRFERGKRGFETIAFSRERRYWIDNHLIGLVYEDRASDNGNAQGMRTDIWGFGGASMSYILSDFSGQSTPGTGSLPNEPVNTDNAHIVRVRKPFMRDDVRTGLTFIRKENRFAGSRGFFEVYSSDVRIMLGLTDIGIEYAQSRQSEDIVVERQGLRPKELTKKKLSDALPTDGALKLEIRSIKIGTPVTGYYQIAPSYRALGRHYKNDIGDGTRDEVGYYINSWYLLPKRAVTLTLNHGEYRKSYDEKKFVTEWYGEAYTEYVNGFTSKFYYRDRKESNRTVSTIPEIIRNRDVLGEMSVQSNLAWLRVQFKIKDMGTVFRKELFSTETSVNITKNTKVYNRFVFGNDPTRTRTAYFSQIQYRPKPNMEIFIQYGPWWIGDSPNPVDDGDLAGSSENKDIIKVVTRSWF